MNQKFIEFARVGAQNNKGHHVPAIKGIEEKRGPENEVAFIWFKDNSNSYFLIALFLISISIYKCL